MEDFSVKVQVGNLQVPDFKAAETTAIKQSGQHTVFEQFGCFGKPADFIPAQDNGKLFAPLDCRKLDTLVLHPLGAVGKAEGIDGELEVGIRRGVVPVSDQVEVIVDLVRIDFSGNLVEMECKPGEMRGVVGQGTGTLACNGNFLAELPVKFTETCYIGTGGLDKVFFFFMIERLLRLKIKDKPYLPLSVKTTVGLVQQRFG